MQKVIDLIFRKNYLRTKMPHVCEQAVRQASRVRLLRHAEDEAEKLLRILTRPGTVHSSSSATYSKVGRLTHTLPPAPMHLSPHTCTSEERASPKLRNPALAPATRCVMSPLKGGRTMCKPLLAATDSRRSP